ncbi:hypothetical protein ZIOFF_011524 [Zingiber officinale]|uniref:Retrovirus-related Pol polyprotein from transposon TNT 1-94-like beta-barrel domain-containing protein n=1 Tax=Zingiber officinale TaxID=94328 RepID=A0A8J5I693_ZINOF|nr:hypothetical protein ZIOFF_011524 [Zingiber officinale]
MEATGSKSVFDAFKLDRFDGTNFTRWKDKLFFLLTELGVAYLLLHDLPPIPAPTDKDTDEIRATRKKREEDESIMDQVDELLVLVSRLKDLKIEVSDPLQVAAVIAKLPTTWNGYRKKLLHTSEDFTIDQLIKHIRIEEETRIRENKFAYESSSKVNNIESKKTKYSGKKRKFAETSPKTFANKKKTKTCYFCGKKGHYKNEYRFFKRLKVEGNVGQKTVSVFERPPSPDIVAMIADLKIGMITECNMATSEKSADWWYDSGASVHVCNERNLFKNYELAAKEEKVLMGNHDTTIVLGKGTIEMQFTSGKKMILTNVLHVPDVRKNLISASLLCKRGLKVVIEAEKLIISKNGVFVGHGYSCDGIRGEATKESVDVDDKEEDGRGVRICELASCYRCDVVANHQTHEVAARADEGKKWKGGRSLEEEGPRLLRPGLVAPLFRSPRGSGLIPSNSHGGGGGYHHEQSQRGDREVKTLDHRQIADILEELAAVAA